MKRETEEGRKESKMKKKSEAFAQVVVGLFMVTVLLLLAYFTIVISGVDVISGRNRVTVRVAFDGVGGLKERDNVMYRGTKVGAIDRVEVTPSNLVVFAEIDSGVVLRATATATIRNLSMLGGNYLALEEGEGEIRPLATTLFVGETPTDWMSDVSKIAKNLREFTSNPELQAIITNVAAASAHARAVSAKADGFMDRANAFAERIARGEGTVGKLLSTNETVYADLKETLANARAVSDRLNRAKLFDDLEAGVAAFRQAAEGVDVKETVARANALLENLNAFATDLKEGNGTIGRLAKDPKLYDEVNGLIRDVRQVIDNYRDTTPISTFTSLATGAF